MERTRNIKKPDLILTSDWHLREDTPICWTGDFQKEQWDSVGFVSDLQEKYNCPVIHAGDLFHHWKPSPWLLSMAIQHLPENFYTVYGQHDLPQHNTELMTKSGLQTLNWAGVVNVLLQGHYGSSVREEDAFILPQHKDKKILVWHHMTYITPPFPGATGEQAGGILKRYPQFDLIVTGDNHQSFAATYKSYEKGERWLVNPGRLTRQRSDEIDFQPRVALWYAEDNSIEWVNIPIQQGVITKEHIKHKEERNERIEAFISGLDKDWDVGMSFEQNLEKFKRKNKISNSIMDIIYKAIEYGKKKD